MAWELSRRSTHSDRLERWLGADKVKSVSDAMRDWYGPPIPIIGVPGNVYANRGGDFIGEINAGAELSAKERMRDILRNARTARTGMIGKYTKQFGGFASRSALIAAATGGKQRRFSFHKTGTTGVVAATNTLWFVGAMPSAGAAAAAAPGGTIPTDATAGSFPFDNPAGGDTQHFISGFPVASVALNTLLLYDRIFSVTKTMNSTATEAVTGVPTRYQNTSAGAADYIGGNFLFIECRTALPATAHNWTVCTYTDQANAASTLPSVTGNSSNIVNRLDQPTSTWFCPLEAGDVGIKALTQMQCSALVASGAIDFTIGHSLGWMPCQQANVVCVADGTQSSFNLERIFDDAAMAFLEITKSATGATTYTGEFIAVRG